MRGSSDSTKRVNDSAAAGLACDASSMSRIAQARSYSVPESLR
jgi:hypothetical protein